MTKGAIKATELRAALPDILRRVRRGERILVLYRGRPAFQLVPLTSGAACDTPLESDPLFRAAAVGRSHKGLATAQHERLLYPS